MDFILNNIEAVEMILVAIILAVWAIFTRQWGILQIAAYRLMLSAERLMATDKGKTKMEAVYAAVWVQVPDWLKKFITEKTLREKLQEWYNLARDSLSDNSE